VYKDTITLFNRKEGTEGDVWYPTILRNVQVNVDRAAILAKYGAESADSAVLNVRYTQAGDNKLVCGKPWLPPKQWDGIEDHSSALTFTTGNRFDFFWIGEWDGTDPVRDSDYFSDTDFYTYMNRTHDYVFAVSSVGGPYSVIPHFEIMGK
jgi:hypothetical protein